MDLEYLLLKLHLKWAHHHYDDHGAGEHARQPGLFWEVGLFDPSHWILLHSRGHGCKLWPRTLLKDSDEDTHHHHWTRSLIYGVV